MSVATALEPMLHDLRHVFDGRLRAVVVYGSRPHQRATSLVLVESLTLDDLGACAARTAAWQRADIATPLILTSEELARSMDAFPLEYDEIIATGEVIVGVNPFDGLEVAEDDLRRACEVQVKSLLLHLREDYLESGGRPGAVTELVRESAPAFAALLAHLARLDRAPASSVADLIAYAGRRPVLESRLVGDLLTLAGPEGLPSVDPARLFPAYLDAVERLAQFVDGWRR